MSYRVLSVAILNAQRWTIGRLVNARALRKPPKDH